METTINSTTNPVTMAHISGPRFARLMRKHGWTVRTLAHAAGVTQDRVRFLRITGLYQQPGESLSTARLNVWGWTKIITGK